MIDRLTTIENAVESLLLSVQGQQANPWYKFYTQTGTVNVEDAALAEGLATELGIDHPVQYLLDIDDDEGETILEAAQGFDTYQNVAKYELIARVENVGKPDNPKKDIKKRMNEVVSDIKQLFWENETLDQNAFRVIIEGWKRSYIGNGDQVNTGRVTFILNIEYGQFGSNPDKKACEF